MDLRNTRTIEANIRTAIKRMRADGITGCSLDCLFHNTPTAGLTCPVVSYRPAFNDLAPAIAVKYHFNLYKDHPNEPIRQYRTN